MIKTITKFDIDNLRKTEYIRTRLGEDGKLVALDWTFDNGLNELARTYRARWNKAAGGWTFADPVVAQKMLDAIIKKRPDWPVVGGPAKPNPFAGLRLSRVDVPGTGLVACLVSLPLPTPDDLNDAASCISYARPLHVFKIAAGKKQEAVVFFAVPDSVDEAIASMVGWGATCDSTLAAEWKFGGSGTIQLKVNGWAVQVICDLSNPHHYLIAPNETRWEGSFPYGIKVPVPWAGTTHTTRKRWPDNKKVLQAFGLEWQGDDPEAELTVPVSFNSDRAPGWNTPAPNGYLLHAYQKEGAEFCAKRGMRALIGDEMGVGKTAQAIAAAQACGAPRIVVICPANARYVWEREILGWGGQGAIQHVTTQLDKLDMSARWHIITYDLVAARAATWRFEDRHEEDVFRQAFPSLVGDIVRKDRKSKAQITFEKALEITPSFGEKRAAAWEVMMTRLKGELLEQILAVGPILAILDEAHRVKNRDAKRTKAIQRIAASEAQMLLLTGTPLRNNEHEAAVLLGLLDASAAAVLSKARGYTIDDVKDYLSYLMIRRTKAEVLPNLPPKTHQRIDISALEPNHMGEYHQALDWARESYELALAGGMSDGQAHQQMRGGIEKARTALGLAKVMGGQVVDLIMDVVENKGCTVVFCAHHEVSDSLHAQLVKEKLKAAVVDGRTPQKKRAALVDQFQAGELEVFIGGIYSAGEAITLTRADTVIFVELEWVPAALWQAEDRIHRGGQLNNCQVIQLIAKMRSDDNLDEMTVEKLGSKIELIGNILDEDTRNVVASSSVEIDVLKRLLAKPRQAQDEHQQEPDLVPAKVPAKVKPVKAEAADKEKRGRGRPKIYVDVAPPSAAERSKRSIKVLAEGGGKRIMLRLTSEAYQALKSIMEASGVAQETAAINQAIVAAARRGEARALNS